jgi:hypothetical protein
MTTKAPKAIGMEVAEKDQMLAIAEKDRVLFWKYAVVCVVDLVHQGKVEQAKFDSMMQQVSGGKIPAEDVNEMFSTAIPECTNIARLMKKRSIDDEVIRTYFLLLHTPVVDRGCDLLLRHAKDTESLAYYADLRVACKVYTGKVLSADGNSALVRTVLGDLPYSADFYEVHEGDDVAVHFKHVVDVLPKEWVKKVREASLKS